MRETSLHHSHPSLDDGGIQPISKADFERLNTCVRDLIEEERARLDSPAIIDVASGMLSLSERDRATAIAWLCRSLVERKARGIVEELIKANLEYALQQSTLDVAMLAIVLCGADEARDLFPCST